jgi:hypothetical protein
MADQSSTPPNPPAQPVEEQPPTLLEKLVAGFPDFWERHGNTLLISVAAVALILAVGRIVLHNQASFTNAAWTELDAADSAEAYRGIAERYAAMPVVAAAARIRAGDALLEKVREQTPSLAAAAGDEDAASAAGDAPGDTPGAAPAADAANTPAEADAEAGAPPVAAESAVDVETLAGWVRSALELYEAVHDQPGLPEVYAHNAAAGEATAFEILAALEEDPAHWERAASLWKQLADETADYPMLRTLAEGRRRMIQPMKRQLVFARPEPETDDETAGGANRPAGSLDGGLDLTAPAPGAGFSGENDGEDADGEPAPGGAGGFDFDLNFDRPEAGPGAPMAPAPEPDQGPAASPAAGQANEPVAP